jgi:hypothetical protein
MALNKQYFKKLRELGILGQQSQSDQTEYMGKSSGIFGRDLDAYQSLWPSSPNSNFGQLANPSNKDDNLYNLGINDASEGNADSGFGWNKGTADTIGAGFSGIGNLARGWAAIKGLGIAEKQLDENTRQFNQNYGMQVKALNANVLKDNNRTKEVNLWKKKQGRTDYRDLVPALA